MFIVNEHTDRFGRKHLHQNTYYVSLTTLMNLLFFNFGCFQTNIVIRIADFCYFVLMFYLEMIKTSVRECVFWLNVVRYNSVECN